MNIEIVICTEHGRLEAFSKLLVYSIRTFGGPISNAPIYSYKPRKGNDLEQSTLDFFEQYNVHFIDLELNSNYPDYALANKPLACAHREQNTTADYLMFLDSDVFFMNPPKNLNDIQHCDLMMRPVDIKNVGSYSDFSDERGAYWKSIYELLGVNSRRCVHSTVDNEEILEYYNSGMIISQTKNRLFQRWKVNFEKVMEQNLHPLEGLFFVEQSVLAATISSMDLNVKLLDKYHNYPIHINKPFLNKEYDVTDFSQLVNIHYHHIFNDQSVNPIEKELFSCENGKVIHQKLIEFGLIDLQKIPQ